MTAFTCSNCGQASRDGVGVGIFIDASSFENGDGAFIGGRRTCYWCPGIYFATRDDFDNYVEAKASGGVAS